MIAINDKAQQTLTHLGLTLRATREASQRTQDDVATAAKIGRSTLVHIESGKSANLASILAVANVLGLEVAIADAESAQVARRLARLVQDAKAHASKEAHLRLALLMLTDAAAAKPLVTVARNAVRLWRTNKSCSPLYIDAWDKILTGTARDVGKSIAAMDARFANALHQNTPFASVLVANRIAAK